jgi:hypothetical protein
MLLYSRQQRTVGKEFSKHVLQAGFNNSIKAFVIFSAIRVVKCCDYSRTELRTKLTKIVFSVNSDSSRYTITVPEFGTWAMPQHRRLVAVFPPLSAELDPRSYHWDL